jgi:hypothetical protein
MILFVFLIANVHFQPAEECTPLPEMQKAHSSANFRHWQTNCIPFRSGDQTRNPKALADGISSANVGSEAT